MNNAFKKAMQEALAGSTKKKSSTRKKISIPKEAVKIRENIKHMGRKSAKNPHGACRHIFCCRHIFQIWHFFIFKNCDRSYFEMIYQNCRQKIGNRLQVLDKMIHFSSLKVHILLISLEISTFGASPNACRHTFLVFYDLQAHTTVSDAALKTMSKFHLMTA